MEATYEYSLSGVPGRKARRFWVQFDEIEGGWCVCTDGLDGPNDLPHICGDSFPSEAEAESAFRAEVDGFLAKKKYVRTTLVK